MNIMAKQEGHAMVASFDSQYRHCGESDEIAAPQFGQLRVCASIRKVGTAYHSKLGVGHGKNLPILCISSARGPYGV
jgi:hypothetical protein